MILRHLLFRLVLLALCLATCACSTSRPRSPYPPLDTLRMAEPQRHEFIQLFLQGRWCEAGSLFDRSVESYLMQDDFCAAAQNHLLSWKLKAYIGLSDEDGLKAAQRLLQTGKGCPQALLPATHLYDVQPDILPEKDRMYRELLQAGQFHALVARLNGERDQLYASVYGRKAAQAAIQAGELPWAHTLIEQTRALDARQGWVVFLIQDWLILHDLAQNSAQQAEILQRIKLLQNLIQPCPL